MKRRKSVGTSIYISDAILTYVMKSILRVVRHAAMSSLIFMLKVTVLPTVLSLSDFEYVKRD